MGFEIISKRIQVRTMLRLAGLYNDLWFHWLLKYTVHCCSLEILPSVCKVEQREEKDGNGYSEYWRGDNHLLGPETALPVVFESPFSLGLIFSFLNLLTGTFTHIILTSLLYVLIADGKDTASSHLYRK